MLFGASGDSSHGGWLEDILELSLRVSWRSVEGWGGRSSLEPPSSHHLPGKIQGQQTIYEKMVKKQTETNIKSYNVTQEFSHSRVVLKVYVPLVVSLNL